MQVTRMFQLTNREAVDESVDRLLGFAEYPKIFRWFQFPTALVVFLAHDNAPDCVAIYVYDRKRCVWLWVDFDDRNFGGYTGCGKTLHGCHPERSEGSRSAYLLENAQGQILRFAQNDSFEEFFRSLYSPSEFDVLAHQCRFFGPVESPGVLESRVQWFVAPGQRPTVLERLPA